VLVLESVGFYARDLSVQPGLRYSDGRSRDNCRAILCPAAHAAVASRLYILVGKQITDFQPGDEVFGSVDEGAFAEYVVLKDPDKLAKKPKSVSFDECAASVMSGCTALGAIRDAAKVKEGTSVLINGASGGVGTSAVQQMPKAREGVVTGVCSGRNVDLVKSLGADRVIDYTKEDYTELPQRYDVILDNVLNRSFKESAAALKDGGFKIPNSLSADRSKWFGAAIP